MTIIVNFRWTFDMQEMVASFFFSLQQDVFLLFWFYLLLVFEHLSENCWVLIDMSDVWICAMIYGLQPA